MVEERNAKGAFFGCGKAPLAFPSPDQAAPWP
jgi:hypothetical protein